MSAEQPAKMTLFVDQLTVMDFSYLDENRGVVGESWIVDVNLDGKLNEQGMIFDFGQVKKQLKAEIDKSVDHKLIIPPQLPSLQINQNAQSTEIAWSNSSGQQCLHSSPKSAIVLLEAESVGLQPVKAYLEQRLRHLLPDNANNLSLSIYPEPGLQSGTHSPSYYHYSHGLRKHRGDCQRIAHGHRSKIEIYENETRAPQLERQWCERWTDIYIGTKSDLSNPSNLPHAARSKIPEDMYRFEYKAEQGRFMIQLPQKNCYLIDNESTVEHIAAHIAETLKQQSPDSTFTVKAYEGIKKGAIARR